MKHKIRLEETEEKYTKISWSLMRAMRNRIVHVYFKLMKSSCGIPSKTICLL